MAVTLAFYKGRGARLSERLQDGAIRKATGGIYSHVELIGGDAACGSDALCLSSSGRDGGVRERPIFLKASKWDLLHLDVDAAAPVAFVRRQLGARYDYAGIMLSHVLAFGRHDPERWFCSEICAAALGIPNAHRISPQMLFDVVNWRLRGVRA